MDLASFFGQLLDKSALGLTHALSLDNLLYCGLGVTLGTFLGALPGIGVLVAMSLLFPVTFHLEPTAAIIMLGGIYYGTAYGGSMASILLNVPGTPANAVTCLDGYPMAKQGRAAVALSMTAVSSFIGASVGIILMMLFSPLIAEYALEFGPSEYFALMLMGTAVKPEVPVWFKHPYGDYLWPRFRAGALSVSTQSIDMPGHPDRGPRQAWNLGQKLGLRGHASLAPLALWLLGLGALAARAARRDDT